MVKEKCIQYISIDESNQQNEDWDLSVYVYANGNTFYDLGGHDKVLSVLGDLTFTIIKNIFIAVYFNRYTFFFFFFFCLFFFFLFLNFF